MEKPKLTVVTMATTLKKNIEGSVTYIWATLVSTLTLLKSPEPDAAVPSGEAGPATSNDQNNENKTSEEEEEQKLKLRQSIEESVTSMWNNLTSRLTPGIRRISLVSNPGDPESKSIIINAINHVKTIIGNIFDTIMSIIYNFSLSILAFFGDPEAHKRVDNHSAPSQSPFMKIINLNETKLNDLFDVIMTFIYKILSKIAASIKPPVPETPEIPPRPQSPIQKLINRIDNMIDTIRTFVYSVITSIMTLFRDPLAEDDTGNTENLPPSKLTFRILFKRILMRFNYFFDAIFSFIYNVFYSFLSLFGNPNTQKPVSFKNVIPYIISRIPDFAYEFLEYVKQLKNRLIRNWISMVTSMKSTLISIMTIIFAFLGVPGENDNSGTDHGNLTGTETLVENRAAKVIKDLIPIIGAPFLEIIEKMYQTTMMLSTEYFAYHKSDVVKEGPPDYEEALRAVRAKIEESSSAIKNVKIRRHPRLPTL